MYSLLHKHNKIAIFERLIHSNSSWICHSGVLLNFFLPSSPLSLCSLYVIFPERAPTNESLLTNDDILLGVEAGSGRDAGMQAGFQLALLVTTLAVSILGGLLTGKGSSL